jgi:hypothetical protein
MSNDRPIAKKPKEPVQPEAQAEAVAVGAD